MVVFGASCYLFAIKGDDRFRFIRFAIANTKVYDSLGMGVPSGLMGRQLGTRPIFDSSMKGGS